jgi:hypothetical protein
VLVLVFGFVLVVVLVHRSVVVRVRLFVRRGVLVLVLVIVIAVAVLVRVLDAVGVLVRMPVLVSHGGRFGPRAAAALPKACRRSVHRAVARARNQEIIALRPRER